MQGPQPKPIVEPPQIQAIAAAEPQDLFVFVGKSALVESSLPIDRISVGLGDYAVATAVSSYEVLLNGKAPGATSMIIWQQGGTKIIYDVVVRQSPPLDGNRLLGVERQVRLELPGQDVHLTQEGDIFFLRGKVNDMTSADRAYSIASVLGKTVNLLYVEVPTAEPQILLKVKFASVDRNDSNVLGINLFSTGATNTIGSLSTGQFSSPIVNPAVKGGAGVTLSEALNLFLFRPDLNLGATIQALETKGVLEVLSEPNILAQNGQVASFLAGGEFPFPVVQGSTGGGAAAVTIQFREFGVRLTFLPTITPRGTIILRVEPEVSALDFTNGLSVNGFNVPALTVRKLNTVVELNQGQSFAIGGLLDDRVTDTFEKIPFLGDIPILGKFFQSRSRTKTNTELLVIVTPELFQSIPQGVPVPGLHYPLPFLPPNTPRPIGTPGTDGATAVDTARPGLAIPVETLIKSLLKEAPNQAMQVLQMQPLVPAPPKQ
jgi:pilus assembly protein CpaC